MSESTADRNSFEILAEEFAERIRRGEHPSLTEYVERYPEHADDIRDLFPALVMVEQFKPARQEVNGCVGRWHVTAGSRKHSLSSWATTGSSAGWAKEAWASSMKPFASRSTITWHSR